MSLMAVIKFGYALVIITLILMLWASLSRAKEFHLEPGVQYPPCQFNSLCTCSKSNPDLGFVACRYVPLYRVPPTINSSKVFMLHLENNGLRDLEPFFFQSTGLYRLAINKNPLGEIPEEAFVGLERSLWELELHQDDLISVPSKALRYLLKLRILDLTGNQITYIASDSWKGLENSLQTLKLAENSITNLPADTFSSLPLLETLDLRGNHISRIDTNVFRDGMARLSKLLLADNQLMYIPYEEISPLKQLKHLDLSSNRIIQIPPNMDLPGLVMSLDLLRLEYNAITHLMPASFQYFSTLNTTILDGNPIAFIREDAFRKAKIRILSLRDCGLTEISPAAFAGLESSLQSLDLSANNLTTLPRSIFHQFDFLRYLSLRENEVHNIVPGESFNGFQYTLFNLDLSGYKNGITSLQDLRRMRSLRSLSLSRLPRPTLMSDDFQEFGVDLDELRIVGGSLDVIQAHAFRYLRTIKSLDLSENEISKIDKEAFLELGHGLTHFKISNGLADSMQDLPHDALKALTQLQYLDISNNRIKNVPDTSFHFLKNLKRIEMQDNLISRFYKGTLQRDIHESLESIILSFNRLSRIDQHTFVDLQALKEISLEDNQIEKLERRAFMNLDRLRKLSLRGNKLREISDETFLNLPELEILDLSYNHMATFEFSMFDQVGMLGLLKVNASHNKINKLSDTIAAAFGAIVREPGIGIGTYHSNIKALDLSYNNISYISRSYFRSAEVSLMHLYLSNNKLQNVTRDVFGNVPHLQVLDFSNNDLLDLEFDSFKSTKKLQVIKMSHNSLIDIPPEVFRSLDLLRIVELAHNDLKMLPDNLFPHEGLEKLDLSNNDFSRIPVNCFAPASAATLTVLDLSGNCIPAVGASDFMQKFRYYDYDDYEMDQRPADWRTGNEDHDYNNNYHSVRRPNHPSQKQEKLKNQPRQEIFLKALSWLDLSNNRLIRVDSGALANLPRLSWLDLGHNGPLSLGRGDRTFQGLENTLTHLGLENVSLSSVPSLPLPLLRSLDLSHNNLPSVPPDTATNLTQLRYLDLSDNDLTTVPIVTHSLSNLRWLSLARNPISTITNTSLLGVAEKLEHLDITGLRLSNFEMGALAKMQALRSLTTTAYTRVRNFNLPTILGYNSALRDLWIEVDDEKTNLGIEMLGQFPCKLHNITFSGIALRHVSDNVLTGVHNPSIRFALRNTSITTLNRNMFTKSGRARNLTLDLRHNRINTVDNPSTGVWPGIPSTLFLHALYLEDNPLTCDCSLGWVEVWERKRRQYLCGDIIEESCMTAKDDLRFAKCLNKNNDTLIEVLKYDIECGWGGSSSLMPLPNVAYIVGMFFATLLYL